MSMIFIIIRSLLDKNVISQKSQIFHNNAKLVYLQLKLYTYLYQKMAAETRPKIPTKLHIPTITKINNQYIKQSQK
jgi:hypothetical protein